MMRGGGRSSRRSAEEAQQLRNQSVLSGFWSRIFLIKQSREAFVVVGVWGARFAASRSLMALKAETPLTDYTEVSSAISRFREKEKMAADYRFLRRPSGKPDGGLVNPADKGQYPFSESAGQDELGISWKQEYLVADDPDDGRLVCMVCGGILATSGPAAARQHILQQHAHSLDFTLEEKRNILEGWSEGVVLPAVDSPPAGGPGENKQPAEIEVLLDTEEQPVRRKRRPVQARRAEGLHLEAERRLSVRQRTPAKESRGQEPMEAAGKEWLSECGLPGSAPAEIRIFTDGSFPAGFTLKLYCRSQPEPSEGTGTKTNARKKTVDRDCSVSLLRLHSRDTGGHLHPSQDTLSPRCPLGSSADSRPKDCGAVRGVAKRGAPAGKEASTALGKGFNPSWRARFLVDFDDATGHLVCMVCEYPLRRICLATVKQHILQCHAETLQMPREVRRTIREVWENRCQPSAQAPRK
ncbi:spindlin interactor and repressor of chromatin-binding protein isoform X1 [Pantherophis guttatus]|uniref:Spindlin interactor and repressor of chromatin-binding protein isoform X1 n=2 Tax=Pantherophis guttatus TaxID=94885 RepID=A0A6P9CCP8_PANGU|nr:spindlin interactor and repressor of chromatin-binding protein isoform X1 [Pantherophis guttatus]